MIVGRRLRDQKSDTEQLELGPTIMSIKPYIPDLRNHSMEIGLRGLDTALGIGLDSAPGIGLGPGDWIEFGPGDSTGFGPGDWIESGELDWIRPRGLDLIRPRDSSHSNIMHT